MIQPTKFGIAGGTIRRSRQIGTAGTIWFTGTICILPPPPPTPSTIISFFPLMRCFCPRAIGTVHIWRIKYTIWCQMLRKQRLCAAQIRIQKNSCYRSMNIIPLQWLFIQFWHPYSDFVSLHRGPILTVLEFHKNGRLRLLPRQQNSKAWCKLTTFSC